MPDVPVGSELYWEILRNDRLPWYCFKGEEKAQFRTGECPMDQGYPWLMSDPDDFCSRGVRIGGDDGKEGTQASET